MYKRRQYTWSDGKSLRLFDHTLIMGILMVRQTLSLMVDCIIHPNQRPSGHVK